jgi:hypothetical protein
MSDQHAESEPLHYFSLDALRSEALSPPNQPIIRYFLQIQDSASGGSPCPKVIM